MEGTLAVARGWYDRAVAVALEAGLGYEAGAEIGMAIGALLLGPEHLDEGERVLRAALERWKDNQRLQFDVGWRLGVVLIRNGRVEEGRMLVDRAIALAEEMGWDLQRNANFPFELAAWAERYADAERAERLLRQVIAWRGTVPVEVELEQTELASILCDQGRAKEAFELVETHPDPGADVQTQVRWRSARARVLSGTGSPEHDSVQVAREAVVFADRFDRLDLQADARVDLAEVLLTFDHIESARHALQEAEALYERKGIPPYDRLLRLRAQAGLTHEALHA
jgi:tetratricopeptide (TPR) repeat protein